MKLEGRYNLMKGTIHTISNVCTSFREEGISVRFLNFSGDLGYNHVRSKEELNSICSEVAPNGRSMLGTVLKNKIVEPLILEKARNQRLKRPVLVTIITDGQVSEPEPIRPLHVLRNSSDEYSPVANPPGS
jgi:hypothetical protein